MSASVPICTGPLGLRLFGCGVVARWRRTFRARRITPGHLHVIQQKLPCQNVRQRSDLYWTSWLAALWLRSRCSVATNFSSASNNARASARDSTKTSLSKCPPAFRSVLDLLACGSLAAESLLGGDELFERVE